MSRNNSNMQRHELKILLHWNLPQWYHAAFEFAPTIAFLIRNFVNANIKIDAFCCVLLMFFVLTQHAAQRHSTANIISNFRSSWTSHPLCAPRISDNSIFEQYRNFQRSKCGRITTCRAAPLDKNDFHSSK